MKKIFVCIILCLCLTGCSNNTAKDQDVITYEISEIANITMTIDNVTPTGATILITDNTGEENVYGEWYRIEKFENEDARFSGHSVLKATRFYCEFKG